MSDPALTILVVDDEPTLREVLSLRLADWGHRVHIAADVSEAEAVLATVPVDVVLTDLVMPGRSGLELLRAESPAATRPAIIVMTAHGSVDTAVEAMKSGATDFLTKPIDALALRALLAVTAAERRQRAVQAELDGILSDTTERGGLVGESTAMRELQHLIGIIASSDAVALITGESGTGKEVVARSIHARSRRRDGPFVAVNAAALPEGLIESEIFGHEAGAFTGAVAARPGCFEQAHGGTLFLDELAEMPIALQPKLLRILEAGTLRRLGGSREIAIDVRLLAATNRKPLDAVREGRLREDLYYRLALFEPQLPPLRARRDDLPLLTRHFVRDANLRHGTAVDGASDAMLTRLAAWEWPGNVRELRNVIERAVIVARSGWLEPAHLPPYLRSTGHGELTPLELPAHATLAEVERLVVLRALERSGQNKAEAARQLGIDVKTVRAKLRRTGESV